MNISDKNVDMDRVNYLREVVVGGTTLLFCRHNMDEQRTLRFTDSLQLSMLEWNGNWVRYYTCGNSSGGIDYEIWMERIPNRDVIEQLHMCGLL